MTQVVPFIAYPKNFYKKTNRYFALCKPHTRARKAQLYSSVRLDSIKKFIIYAMCEIIYFLTICANFLIFTMFGFFMGRR